MNNKKALIVILLFFSLTALFSWLFWRSVSQNKVDPLELGQKAVGVSPTAPQGKTEARSAAANAHSSQTKQMSSPLNQPASQPPPQNPSSALPPETSASESDLQSENSPKETEAPGDPYESKKLGIGMKIPTGYQVSEKNGRLEVASGDIKISMKVYDNDLKAETDAWFKEHFGSAKDSGCVLKDSDVKIGTLATKWAEHNEDTCANGGYIAQNAEKSKVIKIDDFNTRNTELASIVSSVSFSQK